MMFQNTNEFILLPEELNKIARSSPLAEPLS